LSQYHGRLFLALLLTFAPTLASGSDALPADSPREGGKQEPKKVPPVTVRHLSRTIDGWSVAETANFRIYYTDSSEFADQAARVAERTRSAASRKWLGDNVEDNGPRCDVYLYATGEDYSKATGVSPRSPGHTTIRGDEGHIVSRRIDLRCDDPNLLAAVLPHEVTHVVVAGRLGSLPVPPWANEGMAVLTEPRSYVERHLRDLPRYRRDQVLFSSAELIQLQNYPSWRLMGPFYAQSVSLVEFLAAERGPQTFTYFVRAAARDGYEAALKHYYGWDFDALDRHWRDHAFGEGADRAAETRR
jgi:hypothetical protein